LASILGIIDEILNFTRRGLLLDLRRSQVCTNINEI